jgi:hypothetical protein
MDDLGHAAVIGAGESAPGVRNVVPDAAGNAYAADSANARILVFPFGQGAR